MKLYEPKWTLARKDKYDNLRKIGCFESLNDIESFLEKKAFNFEGEIVILQTG